MGSQAKARSVWGSFFAAFAGTLLIAVLVLAVAVGGVPLIVKGQALSVYGDSMAPVFGRGDVIVVRGVEDPGAIKEGQIISYHTGGPGSPVATRRVVGQEDDGSQRRWIVRGEADQLSNQEVVAEDQIVGMYMYRLPKLGYAVSWASEHGLLLAVAALITILAVALIVVLALRRSGRRSRSAPDAARSPGAEPTGDARPLSASKDGAGVDKYVEAVAGTRTDQPTDQATDQATDQPTDQPTATPGTSLPPAPAPIGASLAQGRRPPARRRASAKRADLADTLTSAGGSRPKPVPWRPGPAAAGGQPSSRPAREDGKAPTWDEVVAGPSGPAPRVERLVSTRPDTVAKPVAFVPKGPAMAGQSTGELPVRQPRRIAGDLSLAARIPHARVPVHPAGEAAAASLASGDILSEALPATGPRRPTPPVSARIPRAHTPPGTPPDLPAVVIERAVPFGRAARRSGGGADPNAGSIERPDGPAEPESRDRPVRSDRIAFGPPAQEQPADPGGAFEPLRHKAAQAMLQTGELRLVREAAKPRLISRDESNGS
ncbi:MAG: signal peptidase I [Bifidobacteriaceae bacterium]|nr:signal peptidase I [Bifidobacteriaceae bacterium]